MSRENGKLKLLIYGEYFLPVVGGVQTAMNLLAKGLMELNSHPERNAAGCKIDVTIATRTLANGMDDSVPPYRVVRRPGFWRLVTLIRNADVIHVAGPCLLPMAIAWLIRKPIVVEHHGYQAVCPNGLLFQEPSKTICPGHFDQRHYGECLHCTSATMGLAGGIRSLLLTFPRRWFCKRVAANISITDHVDKRIKLPRTRTIYYGIEEPQPLNGKAGPPLSQPLRIAYVGRLVPEKGLSVLVEAARFLQKDGISSELSFIGDGPERKRLEESVANSGLSDRVLFTGDLRGGDLDRAVSKVAVVIMPSLWEETAGLSAIEQMVRGRVVVTADIGGLSEVVGAAGLKFSPGDSRALAGCIRKVIDNPALTVSLGLMARERATRLFSLNRMIQGHVSLYHEASR